MELRETWTTRELPILRAALAELDSGAERADLDTIRVGLGIEASQVRAAVEALATADPPYIDVQLRNGWDGTRSPGSIDLVYERARRELGTWPTAESFISELAAALRQAAERETQPEEKTKLRATADALLGFGRDVAVQVAARYIPA